MPIIQRDHPEQPQPARQTRGQVLALLALVLAGLLGFMALAIDGGIIFADRRGAQNAADMAALSGALARIRGSNVTSEALGWTARNGYTNNNQTIRVLVNNPPLSGPYAGNAEYVQVIIHSTVRTYFAQIFVRGPIVNTVEAVARSKAPVAGGEVGGMGGVIHLTAPSACLALESSGGGSITVNGHGGIFVNSDGNGLKCYAARINGGGTINGGPDGIHMVGRRDPASNFAPPIVDYPNVAPRTDPLASLDPPVQACSGPALVHDASGPNDIINPGRYSVIRQSGGKLTLTPGVYCFDPPSAKDAIKLTGSSQLIGDGVLIYIRLGGIDITGSAITNILAPTAANCSGLTCSYKGMLFFSDRSNNSKDALLKFAGGAGSIFVGTIYAPNSSIEVSGGSILSSFRSKIISQTLGVNGGGAMTIFYEPTENYSLPSSGSIELAQ